MTEKIQLMCIRKDGKLRIRFHSYTDAEGKTFTGVYNNTYNCQFPRNIREEGRFYEIGKDDLILSGGNGKTPFYRVRADGIKQVDPVAARPEHVFEVTECVICLEAKPDQLFIPCAHLCCCSDCWLGLKASKRSCPLCRRNIITTILNEV